MPRYLVTVSATVDVTAGDFAEAAQKAEQLVRAADSTNAYTTKAQAQAISRAE